MSHTCATDTFTGFPLAERARMGSISKALEALQALQAPHDACKRIAASEQISRCAEIGPVLASLRDGEGGMCNKRLQLTLMAQQHSCHAVLSCREATDKAIMECKGEDLCRLFTSRAANTMDRVWDWLLDALRSSQPMQLSAVQQPIFECLDASATWLKILRSVESEEDEFGIEGLDPDVRKAARSCLEILLQRGAVGKLVSAIAAVLLNHQDQAEFERMLLVSAWAEGAATCHSRFRSRTDCKACAKRTKLHACIHCLCCAAFSALRHSTIHCPPMPLDSVCRFTTVCHKPWRGKIRASLPFMRCPLLNLSAWFATSLSTFFSRHWQVWKSTRTEWAGLGRAQGRP